ncbi:MAG TPA: VTT domain-containing protein [Candidatus Paceibacterota bacterium]|nr:VTT domain-containing protein [Candidatus Paceibacterota bacterium]
METMFEWINQFLTSLAYVLPLELFVFLGSFIEEIVAPIPSVLITTLAGSLALAAGYGWWGLLWLAVLASFGKSLGCAILYVIADKAEDFLLVRLGPKIGITHAEVERVGKFFTGGIRDYLILIVIRALPLSPSLPISVGAGIIKIPFAMYNIATFIGNLLRSLLFIAVGYTGFSAYQRLLDEAQSLESLIQIALAVLLAGFVLVIYYLRRVREKRA